MDTENKNNHNLKSAVLVILVLLVGLLVGYYLGKNNKSPEQKNIVTNTISSTDSNQSFGDDIFAIWNNFTSSRDMGAPRINLSYPDNKLILLEYATSQETHAYKVIDYGNKKLYPEIDGGYVNGLSVRAFLGSDKLVVNRYYEDKPGVIAVVDFYGKNIKDLITLQPEESIHEVYGNGATVYVTIANDNNESDLSLKTYMIDAVTLQITPRSN